MAKKPTSKMTQKANEPELWFPVRTMGLARALQKAGYGTRRQTETLVTQGRVMFDGAICEDPRAMVQPSSTIKLDGRHLVVVAKRYYVFHKPSRVVCTAAEAPGRRLVMDYFPEDVPGLTTCGRMDAKTTGLLLVSNDRVWNNELTTSAGLEQEYRIQVKGELNDLELDVINHGINLQKLGMFKPVSIRVIEIMNGRTVMTMVIRSSKVRQIRRLFSTLRHQVILARRIRIGEFRLGDLPAGILRELQGKDVEALRHAARGRAVSDSEPTQR